MTWFRVDDSFYDHPKVTALDDGPCADHALALWLRSGVWCAKQLKDGFISDAQVRKFSGKKKAAEELVRVRLWERVEGGFKFRNWAEYQPTRDQVEAKREKTRNKVTEWRSNHPRNQVTGEVTNQPCNPAPVPSRPVPSLPDQRESERARARDLDEFERLFVTPHETAPMTPVAPVQTDESALDRAERFVKLVRKEFARRWQSAGQAGLWTEHSSPALGTLAAWLESMRREGHVPEAALSRLLDNFFADPYPRSIHFSINHLAKLPQRYFEPRTHGAVETVESLRAIGREAAARGDIAKVREINARVDALKEGGNRARR